MHRGRTVGWTVADPWLDRGLHRGLDGERGTGSAKSNAPRYASVRALATASTAAASAVLAAAFLLRVTAVLAAAFFAGARFSAAVPSGGIERKETRSAIGTRTYGAFSAVLGLISAE